MEIIRNTGYDPIFYKFAEEVNLKLEKFNDPNFKFYEDSHMYTYSGKKLKSVTSILKDFKEVFDKKYWSEKKAHERGVDPSIILNEWDIKSKRSMDLGTKVHKFIEDFLLEKSPTLDKTDSECNERIYKFVDIYSKKIKYLFPIASEFRIFCRKWGLAGTIDQIFLFVDLSTMTYKIIVFDWKTNGEFKDDSHHSGRFRKLYYPFENLYSNNLNEYSIQLSAYRLILLEEFGIETEAGFICHLGPIGPAKIYKCLDLCDPLRKYLDSTTKDIFNF